MIFFDKSCGGIIMKKTIIIMLIALLSVIAICLIAVIAVLPEDNQQQVITYSNNELIETLGIERPNTKVERLFAIRTYEGEADFIDMLKMAQLDGLEYKELDPESNNYMLVTPLKTNTTLTIANLVYNEYEEKHLPQQVVFRANNGNPLPNNYALLLRYTRPNKGNQQYQIKLTQGEKTATYQIINVEEDGTPVKKNQLVKDDEVGGTESKGDEIEIVLPDEEPVDEENSNQNEENVSEENNAEVSE